MKNKLRTIYSTPHASVLQQCSFEHSRMVFSPYKINL